MDEIELWILCNKKRISQTEFLNRTGILFDQFFEENKKKIRFAIKQNLRKEKQINKLRTISEKIDKLENNKKYESAFYERVEIKKQKMIKKYDSKLQEISQRIEIMNEKINTLEQSRLITG